MGTYLVSSVTEDSHWSTRDTRLPNLGIWCIRHILNPNLFKLVCGERGVNVCRYVGMLGMKMDIVRKIPVDRQLGRQTLALSTSHLTACKLTFSERMR